MNNYTNSEFEPKFNDFGDNYYADDLSDEKSDLLTKVMKIRKRYVNYFDFLDAVDLYDKYMDDLYKKYGGKKDFKLALLLKQVVEYLPHYPELKLNKRNKILYLKRATRADLKDVDYNFNNFDSSIKDVKDSEVVKVDVKLKDSNMLTSIMHQMEIAHNVAQANVLDSIQQLEIDNIHLQAQINQIRRNVRMSNKKKNKLINKTLRRKTLYSYNTSYKGIGDILAMQDAYEHDKFYNVDQYANEAQRYKGAMVTKSEADEIDTLTRLKALGVTSRILRRREMKVTRRSKKDIKKQKKMSKRLGELKDENEMIYNLSNGEYDDYCRFEEEMLNYKSENRWK